MKNRNPSRSSILLAGPTIVTIATILLLLALIVFFIVVPVVVRTLIMQETTLVKGTDTFRKWSNVTFPILIKFYLFNVTNFDEAENGGKFRLQEVGPYVWEEKRSKQILGVNEEEDTIEYKEIVWYHFRRDLSVGSQEDTVNIVNAPFLAASTLIYKVAFSGLANQLINFFFHMGESFVLQDVNIRELVFDGVELNLAYETLADLGIVELPSEFSDGKFAFYNNRNGTPTTDFKVKRGLKNHEDFGRILEYDHMKELPFWTNHSLPAGAEQYCNKINGTDATIVPPFITKDRRIEIFVYEVCRSLYLVFNKEVTFQGIPAYEFAPPKVLLQSPFINGDNMCFCPDPGDGLANNCDAAGAIRIFSCKKGIPIGLSLPHFLFASKNIRDTVDGLNPDEEKHGGSFTYEPHTGGVLNIIKRLQIVTEFQRLPGITSFSNITEAYIPIFWLEETLNLGEEDYAEIRHRLLLPLEIIRILRITVLGTLIFTLISGIVMTYLSKTSEQLLLKLNNDIN